MPLLLLVVPSAQERNVSRYVHSIDTLPFFLCVCLSFDRHPAITASPAQHSQHLSHNHMRVAPHSWVVVDKGSW